MAVLESNTRYFANTLEAYTQEKYFGDRVVKELRSLNKQSHQLNSNIHKEYKENKIDFLTK